MFLCCFTLVAQAQTSNLGCYYDSMMASMLCGNMTIQGDPDNICDDGVKLWVEFTPGSTFVDSLVQEAFGSTDSYKVVKPPFIFEPQTAPVSANIFTDDVWSSVIPLPFKFCFFGNKYDQLLIGANGQISFDLSLANQINGYNTIGWPALPYFNSSVNNAIFCPYHDILPSAGGTITYSVEGTAPCRKFIITWNNIPMYDCINLTATQQIVLTEQSYRIDVNLINKPVCPTWLNGVAYMGIQNALGTEAFTPPGYNGGAWTANNESWSFIPYGKQNLTADTNNVQYGMYWVDSFSNNVIGVGDTLYWWPPTDTTIYVFFGDSTLLHDTSYVNGIDTNINICGKGMSCSGNTPYIRLHYYKPEAMFTYTMNPTCVGADVQFTNLSNDATTYYWDFGDGGFDTQPNPMHSYVGTGPYNAMLVAFGFGCSDTMYTTIIPNPSPIVASFTLSSNSVCGPTPISSNNTSTGNNLSYTWNMGDNTIYNTFNITHAYTASGNYDVWLYIEDTISGCKDSTMQSVFVDDDRRSRFSMIPSTICVGWEAFVRDTLNPHAINYWYDMGNGDTIMNSPHPKATYVNPGDYTITLTSNFLVCPTQTETQLLHVDPFPEVELGDMEEICAGINGLIIQDTQNPGASYIWSTGETSNSISVSQPGEYKVTVSYGLCKTEDTKIVAPDLDCIFVPTAFTPNGDLLNDYFKPILNQLSNIGSYRMMIYNRLGQRVYYSEDILDKGWDGKFKGAPCATETYMYFVTLVSTQGSKKTIKGDVTLIR